jgi:hypothetical protein
MRVRTLDSAFNSQTMIDQGQTHMRHDNRSARQTGASLAICLAVVLAWFSPWWAGGLNLAPLDLPGEMMQPWRGGGEPGVAKNHFVSDAVDVILPYHLFAADSFRTEGQVGWSDLTFGGNAQYANTMALYDDWAMQLHRWFDFWTAWHLGLLGQVFLASSGMVLLLRGRGANVVWSSCGGLLYAANSQFAAWIYHRFTLGAFCWVPWILWTIDSHRRGKRWGWGTVPVFIALAFLGGTLQHAAMVALAVMAGWGDEAWQAWRRKGLETDKWLTQARVVGRYAVWGILGTGLSAFMMLPCADALMTSIGLGLHTGIFGNANNGMYPEGILQPLCNLAAYPLQVFPSALGRCNSLDLLKLFKSNLFFIAYIGSIPTLIAYLAIARKDTGTLARLLILIGLLLPLTPAVRYLYQRLLILFLLGGTMAFVAFIEHSKDESRRNLCKVAGWTAGLLAAGWLAASTILWLFGQKLLASLHDRILTAGAGSSFRGCQKWLETRADNFAADLFIWSPQQAIPLLLLAMALWGLGWTASRITTRRNAGSVLLATAAVLEVTVFAARWVVWTDPAKYPLFPETPESAALKEHVGHDGRVSTMIHPTDHLSKTPFVPNTLVPYGIATISGYDSIIPDGMLLPNESPGDAEMLGRFAVSHLVTWAGNPDIPKPWERTWSSETMDLYRNPLVVPHYAGFTNDASLRTFHEGGRFNGIVLQEQSSLVNQRRIEVPAGITCLRIAENQAPGWIYRVDGGKWKNVGRAVDATMEIPLLSSEGKKIVDIEFTPPLRTMGWTVTGFSFATLLLLGLRKAR